MKNLFHQEIYRDKWLLILGIPVVTLLIQHVGLSWATIREYVKDDYYWYNLLFNFSTIFVALVINRILIYQLDQKLPYRPSFSKRVFIQLLLSLVSIITVTEILAYLYVKVWAKADYWEGRFSTDLPVSVILIILVNLIYIGYYLQHETQYKLNKEPLKNDEEEEISIKPFEVSIGNKKFLLKPDEIVFFSSKNKMTKAHTFTGKRYLVNQSLKQVYLDLNQHQFFQANRQFIINRAIIKGYQKLPNRKIELILEADLSIEEVVYISKEKSPAFLKWLEKNI